MWAMAPGNREPGQAWGPLASRAAAPHSSFSRCTSCALLATATCCPISHKHPSPVLLPRGFFNETAGLIRPAQLRGEETKARGLPGGPAESCSETGARCEGSPAHLLSRLHLQAVGAVGRMYKEPRKAKGEPVPPKRQIRACFPFYGLALQPACRSRSKLWKELAD